MWGIVASDIPLILGTVVWLVLLEGLLSADNALVLAVMVRHLPQREQRHALRYGIWGAFIFRLIAVILSTQLMNFWQFQVVGGLYLLYLAVSHFLSGGGDEHDQPRRLRFGSGFWATVVAVELADIAFSIDSIVAAVAMAPLRFISSGDSRSSTSAASSASSRCGSWPAISSSSWRSSTGWTSAPTTWWAGSASS